MIINERERQRKQPAVSLVRGDAATAFRVHPYGHEVIGHMADFAAMTRDDLHGHYKAFYAPNNAIVAVAGDFKRERHARASITNSMASSNRATGIPQVHVSRASPKRRAARNRQGRRRHKLSDLGFSLACRHPRRLHAAGGVGFDPVRGHRAFVLWRRHQQPQQPPQQGGGRHGLSADIGGGVVPTIDPFLSRSAAR